MEVGFDRILVLWFIVAGSLAIVLWISSYYDSTDYILPNGVECDDVFIKQAGYVFESCDDGLKYINPEYYNETEGEGWISH